MAASGQREMSQLRRFLLGVSGQVYIPNLVMALLLNPLRGARKANVTERDLGLTDSS